MAEEVIMNDYREDYDMTISDDSPQNMRNIAERLRCYYKYVLQKDKMVWVECDDIDENILSFARDTWEVMIVDDIRNRERVIDDLINSISTPRVMKKIKTEIFKWTTIPNIENYINEDEDE